MRASVGVNGNISQILEFHRLCPDPIRDHLPGGHIKWVTPKGALLGDCGYRHKILGSKL